MLDDPAAAERVRRVLLCSGKVYYDLLAKRERGRQGARRRHRPDRAALSLAGRRAASRCSAATSPRREWVWVQEESQNMGAWTFVAPRLQELMGLPFQYVGRDASASPATGSKLVHDHEQAELVEAADRRPRCPTWSPRTPVRSLAHGAMAAGQGVQLDHGRRPDHRARRGRVDLRGNPLALAQARRLARQGRRAALRAGDRQGDAATSPPPARRPQDRRRRRRDRRDRRHRSERIDPAGANPAPAAPQPRPPNAGRRQPAEHRRGSAGEAAPPARRDRPERAEPDSLSPAVRRLVAEERRRPSKVPATGPGGRLTKGDVLAYLEASRQSAKPAAADPSRLPRRPGADRTARGRPTRAELPLATARPAQRMSGLRQRIAQRLVEAQQTAAILTTFNEADMSRVIELRTRYKELFQKKHGVGLGFMSFFVKAAVEALKAFPAVNARIDGNEIVYQNYYDIGVAVSTERGLMVPVLRDADQLSLRRDREGASPSFGDEGPRRHDRRRRPPGRHVHDHQRRDLRLAALDADPQPAAERASWACTRSRSGPSSSTTRS